MESLALLLKSIRASLDILFWSLCLLGVIQCIGGMVISQMVKPFLDDESEPQDLRREVFRYYGTFTATLLTMFEVLFANWAPPCRILVDHVAEMYMFVFIIYRCLIGFAVLNVVNAVFVQQTMRVAQADQDLQISQKQKAADAYARKLKAFFKRLDTSGDGYLSWDEFSALLEDEKLQHWMATLELETHDLVDLFHMIDDGDGEISVTEFLDGAARLRGMAKSVDVAQVQAVVRRLEGKVEAVLQAVAKLTGENAFALEKNVIHKVMKRLDASLSGSGMPSSSQVFGRQESNGSGSTRGYLANLGANYLSEMRRVDANYASEMSGSGRQDSKHSPR